MNVVLCSLASGMTTGTHTISPSALVLSSLLPMWCRVSVLQHLYRAIPQCRGGTYAMTVAKDTTSLGISHTLTSCSEGSIPTTSLREPQSATSCKLSKSRFSA